MSLGKQLCLEIINRFDEGTDWAVEVEGGFDWWPGERRISLRYQTPQDPEDSEKFCWIYFFTDVKEDASRIDQTLFTIQSVNCIMSSYIVLENENRLVLGTGLMVISEEADLIFGRILSLAVIQYREAGNCAKNLSAHDASPCVISTHPTKGPRNEPSDFISAFDTEIAPTCEPSDDDNQLFMDHLEGMSTRFKEEGWTLFSGFVNSGLKVEFPFGEDHTSEIYCEIENHPLMGQGIRITQKFPVFMDTFEDQLMPSKMSLLEVLLHENSPSPVFVAGSFLWTNKPFATKSFLNWSCFVPKFTIKTEISQKLKLYLDSKLEEAMEHRARYVSKIYTGIEMTKDDVGSRRDEMELLLHFIDNDKNQKMVDYLREAIGKAKS